MFILLFAGFILLILIRVPVSIAIGAAVLMTFLTSDFSDALYIIPQQILEGVNKPSLAAVPFFIMAGNLMNVVGMTDRIFNFANSLVGHFKAGLAQVNVLSSMIFAGVSGAAVADCAGLGAIEIKAMKERGYKAEFAAAVTVCSAVVGPIIPPSIPMVLYALVSNTSIGSLFLAGILPGLIMGAVLIGMNTLISYRRDFGKEEPVPLKKLPMITLKSFPALLMPVILLTCIYSGVTSPTEAAAIAALYAFILAAGFYRALTIKSLYQLFVESARSSASVALVIGASMILTYVVVKENVPQTLSALLAGAEISPIIFLLLINLLILLVGCILDATVIILVIVPLFIPTCEALGIDLVHFGVLVVVNSMIGLITPPYGMLLFVINAVTDIPLREIIGEIWAFLAVLIFALLIMIFSPNMVLWLPRLFGYQG